MPPCQMTWLALPLASTSTLNVAPGSSTRSTIDRQAANRVARGEGAAGFDMGGADRAIATQPCAVAHGHGGAGDRAIDRQGSLLDQRVAVVVEGAVEVPGPVALLEQCAVEQGAATDCVGVALTLVAAEINCEALLAPISRSPSRVEPSL